MQNVNEFHDNHQSCRMH